MLPLISTILLSAAPSPEGMNIESLIFDLAFILILGAVTTIIFKLLKQPVVLGYIVAGFLASPNFHYLPSVTTESNIEFWAQIGIIVLLFSLGLEFSFKKLVNAGPSALITSFIIIAGMMICGYGVGTAMGFSTVNALFLGGMISISSTTIIIKALTDLGLQHRKFATLVFAVLVVEDLYAVVMMVMLSSIAINNSVEGGEMLWSISKLVFFLVIWFMIGVFLLPSLLNRSRKFLNQETLLIVSMGLCLGMAVLSTFCGFSLALGAFVMGSILAGTSFAERIEHVVTPVKDLFGSVFFISVGLMVNPSVITTYFGSIVLLSLLVIVGMIIFGTLGMLVTGQNLRVSIESGFALTQIGEFSFIIATLGMSLGVLNPELYPVIVAVSVITTFGTPYLIRLAGPVYKFVEKHLPKRLTYLIERNSYDAAKEKSSTKQIWHNIVSRYLWRVLLYSIMLIAIILVSHGWLLPTLLNWNESWGRLLTAVITVGAMAPFVLAMTVPSSRKSERRKLKEADSRFDLPLVIMTVVKLIISLSSLVYILTVIYSFSIGLSIGVAILLTAIFFLSSDLRFKMRRMESKFIDNLNERELRKSGRNNNIVSNLHLAFMTVTNSSPFVGEKLQDSQLRVKYGANIASIQRGSNIIPVPGGDTRLFPGDTLGVIGTDEEIQTILPLIEAPESESSQSASEIDPSDLKLFPVTLTSSSPLIGKTVAQANMREKYTALIVSLERNGVYSQPSAATVFQDGDIVWVVAPNSSMESLNKQ